MISSAASWMGGAQSWLAAPCTYTSAKCLSSRALALQVGLSFRRWPPGGAARVGLIRTPSTPGSFDYSAIFLAFQRVLDDSAQIRSTLQGFGPVLKEMSQVCRVTELQEQLLSTDSRVEEVQDSFTAPLSQLQQAVSVSPRPRSSLLPQVLVSPNGPVLCFPFRRWKTWRGR